jgi:hypothetical protein
MRSYSHLSEDERDQIGVLRGLRRRSAVEPVVSRQGRGPGRPQLPKGIHGDGTDAAPPLADVSDGLAPLGDPCRSGNSGSLFSNGDCGSRRAASLSENRRSRRPALRGQSSASQRQARRPQLGSSVKPCLATARLSCPTLVSLRCRSSASRAAGAGATTWRSS